MGSSIIPDKNVPILVDKKHFLVVKMQLVIVWEQLHHL